MKFLEKKNIIKEHFSKLLEQRQAELDDQGPLSKKQIEAIESGLSVFADMEQTETLGKYTHSQEDMEKFFASSGIHFPASGEEREKLVELYNRADFSAQKALLEHGKQLLTSYNYKKEIVRAAEMTLEESLSLQEVVSIYMKENKNGWSKSTLVKYQGFLKFLLEEVGGDTPIRKINVKTAREVKNALIEKPSHAGKHRTPRTCNHYLSAFSTFFQWSYNNGYSEHTLFKKMSLKIDKNQPKKEHFTLDQLALMKSELLKQKNKIKYYRYWVTLMGMFTGARLGELAQLHKSDIIKEDGIWVFNITEEEDKTLKNQNSIRTVPVHSELIKLGFLDFVKSSAEGMLFPELRQKGNEQTARPQSRWFNEVFLVNLGIKKPKIDFHSFRNSITTYLEQSNVRGEHVNAILGHAQTGMRQVYNTGGYTVIQKQEALEKFKV